LDTTTQLNNIKYNSQTNCDCS